MAKRRKYSKPKATPKAQLIDKLRKKYALNYEDAYYYTQACDYIIDNLLKLGCPLTIPNVMQVKINTKDLDHKKIKANKAYLQRVMAGKEQFYHHSSLKPKYFPTKLI